MRLLATFFINIFSVHILGSFLSSKGNWRSNIDEELIEFLIHTSVSNISWGGDKIISKFVDKVRYK